MDLSDLAVRESHRGLVRSARQRASKIRDGIHGYLATLAVIAEAWQKRDHETLGYDSWDEYVDGEFGTERLRLPAAHRQKAVDELRLAGLSQRAIAKAVNEPRHVIRDDLGGGRRRPPEDPQATHKGESLDAPKPSTPRSRPDDSVTPPQTPAATPPLAPPDPVAVALAGPADEGGVVTPSVLEGGDTPGGEEDYGELIDVEPAPTAEVVEAGKLAAEQLVADVQLKLRLIVNAMLVGSPSIAARELVLALRAAADELEGLL